MTPHGLQWLWPVFFYLVGSVPTGYLIGKARGLDIRQHGSGNIGATNVWRVMGRNWGLLAFACDFLKGFLPLYELHKQFAFSQYYEFLRAYPNMHWHPLTWSMETLLVICGLAAIIGHNFTPWLGFKGGKGIATSAGVLGALLPLVLVFAFSLWLILVLITRTVSIGSIAAAASLAPLAYYFYPGQWIFFGLSVLAGVLAIWQHRTNIQRLIAGTESRIGSPKKT